MKADNQNGSNRVFARLVSPSALLLWGTLAVLLSLAGPFGTYRTDATEQRFLYWFVVVALGVVAGGVARSIVDRMVPAHRAPLGDLLSVALVSAMLSPVLWLLTTRVFWPGSPDMPEFPRFSGYVVVTTALIATIRRMLPFLVGLTQGAVTSAEPDDPPLFRRLPEGFTGPVLRLTVRDHMVDVVTPGETFSIRMRFSDAIAEMGAVSGYCTHRSHWVARSAIDGVQRSNGQVRLVLSNGDEIPVSRKFKPDLEQAGLI